MRNVMSRFVFVRQLLIALGLIATASSFIIRRNTATSVAVSQVSYTSQCVPLKAAAKKKDGYQFGDISRWIGGRIKEQAGNITGKEYEFGDLTKFAVSGVVGSTVSNITGKDYEFGDLTQFAMSAVSSGVTNYTGKEGYEVGDITKAILRRVESGEYSSEDVWLAFKVLLSAGFTLFSPVASALPLKLLIEAINFGLAQEVTARLTTVLAEIVDERIKKMGMSKALGDMAKKGVESGIGKFTGKATYEVGDITRAVQQIQKDSLASKTKSSSRRLDLSSNELAAMTELDPKTRAA